MNKFETRLSEIFKKECVFTGNGTTAMYLAFKALNRQCKKVLFPAITCTNPVNAAIFAGYSVDFCDVTLSDYTIDCDMVEKMLQTGEYGIMVPTHIYGHKYDMERLWSISKEHNVIMFEDAAQTNEIGIADLSVMSFGHSKTYETSGGGGAIFSDDKELLQNIRREKQLLPVKKNGYENEFRQYCNRYYEIMNSSCSDNEKRKEMLQLQVSSKELFLFDLEKNELILNQNFTQIDNMRKLKSREYYCKLENSKIIFPDSGVLDNVLWRFSFLYKGDRDALLKKVREKNIDVSSWYPSVSRIYTGKNLVNASIIENQVVNLWIDEQHSLNQIKKEIEIMNEVMEEL